MGILNIKQVFQRETKSDSLIILKLKFQSVQHASDSLRGGGMDLNVQTFRFVQSATAEGSPQTERKRATSRRGGLVLGPRRAKALSSKNEAN